MEKKTRQSRTSAEDREMFNRAAASYFANCRPQSPEGMAPTLTGLAIAVGATRTALAEPSSEDSGFKPDMHDTIDRCRMRIWEYWEDKLDGPSHAGAAVYLRFDN